MTSRLSDGLCSWGQQAGIAKKPNTEEAGERNCGQSHRESWRVLAVRGQDRTEKLSPAKEEEKNTMEVTHAPGPFSATNSLSDHGQASGLYEFLHLKNKKRAALKIQDLSDIYVRKNLPRVGVVSKTCF